MNDRDGLGGVPETMPPPTAGGLAVYMAGVVTQVSDLKKRIAAGVENQFIEAGTVAGQSMSKVCQWIEAQLQQACACENAITEKVRNWIELKIGNAEFTQNLAEAKVNKAQARLSKKAKNATLELADAQQAEGKMPLQSVLGVISPPAIQPLGGQVPPSSFPAPGNPFPAPPGPGELDNLVLPLKDGGGGLVLASLPAEMWDPLNENRTWLSLEPSVVTRAELSAVRIYTDRIEPAGQIYFNVGLAMPADALGSILGGLGIADEAIAIKSDADAWKGATERFGDIVASEVWDLYGLPHPPVIPGALPPLPPPGGAACAPFPGQAKGPDEFFRALEQFRGFLPAGARGLVPEVPAVAELAGRILPLLQMPTLRGLCTFLQPFLLYFDFDIQKMPPCATLAEVKRYLDEKVKA